MEIWFNYSSIQSHRQQYTHTHSGLVLKWPTTYTMVYTQFGFQRNNPRKMAAFWLTLHQDRIHVAFQSQTTHLL